MRTLLNGATEVLGIIGHPIRHSLSPLMQNSALEQCGMNCVFVPFDVHPEQLGEAIAGIRALGIRGINVTIPHKIGVIPFLDELDESAVAAGAVNTVYNENGRLVGYNTDGDGLIRSLADDLSFVPEKSAVVIFGAGGAARGAVAAICRAGAQRVTIVNRSGNKAQKLVEAMAKRYPGTVLTTIGYGEEMKAVLADADLLLNTTSLGMNGEAIPGLDLAPLSRKAVIYDMVYTPPVTPLLQEAERMGFSCANGLGMLAAQGELAFRIWLGTMPPVGLMKRVLAALSPH